MCPASDNATIDRETDRLIKWSLVSAGNGVSLHSVVISTAVFRVGRRQDMDLRIDSPSVSGFHAELFTVEGSLFVRDVGSTNGTFLNGTQITDDTELSNGDCLDLGGTAFQIVRQGLLARGPQVGAFSAVMKTSSLKNAAETAGERSLARLLCGGTLAPCYQAIYCLQTKVLAGYEFLARGRYPGIESAGQLFTQSAKAGRDVELSVLCRQQAFVHCHLLGADLPIFVNTHPVEPLLDVVLPQMRKLRQAYPDRGMVLEIHESAHTEPGLIRELRKQLATINVQLGFDDFGAGQNRIREMITASADYIKFDPSLIRDLLQVPKEQRRFFAMILNGIKSEGTITVAEGIETAEMDEVCHELEFDLVQGYLYGRPTMY
jgi:EAL domain-containing protein (putative c-di-GMP-specific phosphodiesterase class I)